MAEPRNGEHLELQGFGMRARVRGHDIIVVVLIVILFGAVGFLVWEHDQKSGDRIGILADSQKQMIEEVSALTYVISLSPTEREHLNLSMPESLLKKRKLRDGR